jgi:hypothetical protein
MSRPSFRAALAALPILLGAALSGPAPAVAQGLNINGPPHSFVSVGGPAKDAEGARKMGDDLVRRAEIAAAFENVTTDAVVRLRHRASGLLCVAPRAVVVSPTTEIPAFDPVGEENCVSAVNGFQNDLTIIADTHKLTAAQAVAAVAERLAGQKPDLALLPDNRPQRFAGFGRPQPASARLSPRDGFNGGYIYLTAAVINGWVVIDEVQGQPTRADAAEETGQAEIEDAISNLVKSRLKPPA